MKANKETYSIPKIHTTEIWSTQRNTERFSVELCDLCASVVSGSCVLAVKRNSPQRTQRAQRKKARQEELKIKSPMKANKETYSIPKIHTTEARSTQRNTEKFSVELCDLCASVVGGPCVLAVKRNSPQRTQRAQRKKARQEELKIKPPMKAKKETNSIPKIHTTEARSTQRNTERFSVELCDLRASVVGGCISG